MHVLSACMVLLTINQYALAGRSLCVGFVNFVDCLDCHDSGGGTVICFPSLRVEILRRPRHGVILGMNRTL